MHFIIFIPVFLFLAFGIIGRHNIINEDRISMVLKVLLTVSITALAVVAALKTGKHPVFYWGIVFGLLFCLIGDAVLAWDLKRFFLVGMGAFGIGYAIFATMLLLFIGAFSIYSYIVLLAAVIMSIIVFRSFDNIPYGFGLPLILFIVILNYHVLVGFNAFNSLGFPLGVPFLVGAVSLFISDALIGFSHFRSRKLFSKAGFVSSILSAYYLGIWSISIGAFYFDK